jgi:hypothetical protein
MDTPVATPTQQIDRQPTAIPLLSGKQDVLGASGLVLLQFLPSGWCITACVDQPLILGRCSSSKLLAPGRLVDLSHLGAEKHGVSRQHCQLWRHGPQLLVTDLNSTNGTYLNGERLLSQAVRRLSEGDRLILSTLHMTIFFGTAPTSNPPSV